MADTTRSRIADLLRLHRRREDYLALLSCLALLVATAVTITVMQRAQAMNRTERVLDCQYSGDAAHSHNADCYDKSGTLVCPLPERPLHVHDDSCYTEERHLICGLEEGRELEDGSVHEHTDDCYEVERVLTCGLEELTEEHVHGAGCFKTIKAASEDEERPEEALLEDATLPDETQDEADDQDATAAEDGAMTFDDTLRDEHGNVLVKVHVEAPAGAFPPGTTMRVSAVDDDSITDEVADVVADKTDGKIYALQPVDISFFDARGNEIEPAKPINVTMTSDLIASDNGSMLVHVDSDGKADAVETLTKEELKEREQTLEDDELAFEQG